MIISVINHTNGLLPDSAVQHAIRAVNRQISEDFAPYWGMTASLRLEGTAREEPSGVAPELHLTDMRGDAIIYIWHPTNVTGALGYHNRNFLGIPYGFVFPKLSEDLLGERWTVTLSHEALETIADPDVNLLVMGPHPANRGKTVFHWYEVCDAVQTETYRIDGVEVSNFVLPLYFTSSEEPGSRNDFLNQDHGGRTLPSFGINPGGYVGYFDPETNSHETFGIQDPRSRMRWQRKSELGMARRSQRYMSRTNSAVSASRVFRLS